MNDDNGEGTDTGVLDHLFNALGHLARAQRKSQSESQARTQDTVKKPKRVKHGSFDEAPRDPSCCTAKRE